MECEMIDWVGQLDCKNYRGIKKIEKKGCCGGRIRKRVVVECVEHSFAYADTNCRKQLCWEYERKEDES